ncbi:MAG: VanW family protein [Proteobacteria bacterium]|nr:VanW family protein [Pseudomonadota bacterium]
MSRRRRVALPLLLLAAAAFVLVVSGGLLAPHCQHGAVEQHLTIAGLRLAGAEVGGRDASELQRALARLAPAAAAHTILLRWATGSRRVALARLGVTADPSETAMALLSIGHAGSWLPRLLLRWKARRGRLDVPWQFQLDEARALQFFNDLSGAIDREPAAPRLDLERRRVRPGRQGLRLDPLRALAATEAALRAGSAEVQLPLVRLRAARAPALAGIDVSQVLGHFMTVYSQADVDRHRAHNLRLIAGRIDGQLLAPGARFSFNATVGARTEEQGYRTAAVIQQGELIDGMAGGACQISSTLFAAAFFAGLDLLSSRPHTMPSSYIRLGLDAAVAYPETDLRLGNPYPFPVALQVRVSEGRVRVAILGRRRPWQRVVFRREVKQRDPFGEIERPDATLPRGQRIVTQRGVPGFLVERQRLFFAAGSDQPRRVETRSLRYAVTQQIIRVGTGPPPAPGMAGPAPDPPPAPYRADVEPLAIEQ